MKKFSDKHEKTGFTIIFYRLLVISILLPALVFTLLGIFLQEAYFVKFTIDNK